MSQLLVAWSWLKSPRGIGMVAAIIISYAGVILFLCRPSFLHYFVWGLLSAPMMAMEFGNDPESPLPIRKPLFLIPMSITFGSYYSFGRLVVLPVMGAIASPFVLIWYVTTRPTMKKIWSSLYSLEIVVPVKIRTIFSDKDKKALKSLGVKTDDE